MTTKKEEKSIKLKNCDLYQDDGYLFMSLTYEIEDAHVIKEIHIPKIATCIATDKDLSISHSTTSRGSVYDVELHAGTIRYQLFKDNTEDVYLTEKILYEKPTEMTLEEIEKKLGYKVKIVSKKEKEN